MPLLLSRLGPVLIPHFAPDKFCESIIKYLDHQNSTESINYRTFQGRPQKDKRLAQYEILPTSEHVPYCKLISALFNDILGITEGIVGFDKSVVYRYPVGPGFFMHHDAVTEVERANAALNGVPVVGGDITTVLYLNDSNHYVGGELVFPTFGMTIKPKCGSLVIFPATEYYPHCVNPIIEGERYTLVVRPIMSEKYHHCPLQVDQ